MIAEDLREKWEELHGFGTWKARHFWFSKPFVLLQSPFEQTIWFDLDCEVIASIAHLFYKLHSSSLVLTKDKREFSEEMRYNSGVVIYDVKATLLTLWASACVQKNDQFLGDGQVLTELIQELGFAAAELPAKYNWIIKRGVNPEAAVLHWSGTWGKQTIQQAIV